MARRRGGKTIKDGGEVGWDYVSFRDDNIRVDHKWRDGELMFNRALPSSTDASKWGDMNRKLPVIGGGKALWTGKKGRKISEVKAELYPLALANLKKQSNFSLDTANKVPTLKIDGVRIRIGKSGLFHGADRRISQIGPAIAQIGDVLNASVEVPEVRAPWHYRIAQVDFGESAFVLISSKTMLDGAEEIVDLQRLYSINVKAGNPPQSLTSSKVSHPTTTIISNLQAAWQEIFSKNLQEHVINKNQNLQLSRPIERRKDLIALHNLSAEKLKGADELGGFAMPSVAITKDTIGHGEFGEVSLLLRDRSIDPRQNGRNMIYSGDAYTPTSPSVQYHVKDGKAVERIEKKIADDPRGTSEIWEVAPPSPMRHLTKYTAYVRKGDRRIWGFKGEAECASYLEARAKLFEVKADLEIMMRYHMDSRTSPDHFAVRFANVTSPSRGTLALRAEPGPPTARVTLFALDEANLPK